MKERRSNYVVQVSNVAKIAYNNVGLGGISSLYNISIYLYKRYGMKQYR